MCLSEVGANTIRCEHTTELQISVMMFSILIYISLLTTPDLGFAFFDCLQAQS